MSRRKKIAAFVSHFYGDAVLQSLLSMSDEMEVVFVATDDPLKSYVNPGNRLWSDGWNNELRNLVRIRAEAAGIDVSTGRVKSREFQEQFMAACPDAIVCCVFGQRLPVRQLKYVSYRAYNLHLIIANCQLELTRGPRPIEKAMQLGAGFLQVVMHRMSHEFDRGELLGTSLPFPVLNEQISNIPDYYKATASMAASVIQKHLLNVLKNDFIQDEAIQ